MPTYTYQCKACGHALEASQKITEAPLKKCPKCQKTSLQRGPGGGVGVAFTGSGFYRTDYGNAPKSNGGCCPCGKNKGSCSS